MTKAIIVTTLNQRIKQSVLEILLDKKYTRHKPESSITEERILTIRIKRRRNVRPGEFWAPSVAEFYMEMYPEMIEEGYTISDFREMLEGDFM